MCCVTTACHGGRPDRPRKASCGDRAREMRLAGSDKNAANDDRLARPIGGTVGGKCGPIEDLAGYFQPLGDSAENSVTAVHPRRLAEADVELAGGRIGLGAVPGADRAFDVDHFGVLLRIVRLRFEPVADAAVTGLAGAERAARFDRFVELFGAGAVTIFLAQGGMEG